jgi:hypothetical protein
VAVALLAIATVAGVAALGGLAASGAEPRAKWGYTAATLGFLLSTAQAAPALALASRLGRGLWGVPLRRAADLLGLAGAISTPLLVVLLLQLPDWRGRPSIWFDWPGAPLVWDAVGSSLLAVCGLALVYVGSVPDLAAARDRRHGGLVRAFALGWRGDERQWRTLSAGLLALGALYLMLYTFVHLLVASDLALSLAPGWSSAVIPAYHAVTGLEGGVATTIVVMAALRRFGGQTELIGPAPFHACAKILLALALLYFYFLWSDFLTLWYGRMPSEQWVLALTMFGPYLAPFLGAFVLCFLAPVGLLIWNPIRNSIAGPTTVALLVLVGLFLDRVRLFVPAWSVAGPVLPHHAEPPPLPPTVYPGLVDVAIVAGMLAGAGLVTLLAMRVVPGVSGWERRAAEMLVAKRPYAETEVVVVARPT